VVAKVKYTPIGDAISVESTFVQAAIALDVAAQFAVEGRDTEQMNRTAELWIEMSKALMEIEADSPPPTNRDPLGFTMIRTDKESEDGRRIDTEEPDPSPSEGGSGDDD
jgi:hypothetical protein